MIEQTGQRRMQKKLRKTFGQYFVRCGHLHTTQGPDSAQSLIHWLCAITQCLPPSEVAADAQGLAVPALAGAVPALAAPSATSAPSGAEGNSTARPYVTTGQVGLRVGVVCGTAGEQPKVTVQDVEDEEEVDEGGDRDPTDSDFMAKGALKRTRTHTTHDTHDTLLHIPFFLCRAQD